MSSAMVALATTTLGSAASSVTFGSIPATYRDLRLVVNAYGPGGDNSYFRINADSGANYSWVSMRGDGSTTASNATSSATEIYITTLGTAMTTGIAEIIDYSVTDKHKTVLTRGNDTTAWIQARASRWANTAAVTSIAVTCGGTYSTGSTFSLYGIVS